MFLQEPQRTPYDLNFSFLGFPVRVHPLFWLMSLIMGSSGDAKEIVLWILVIFVSILVHELGHALMIRRYGRDAHIVLYWLGGLAIEGSPDPYASQYNPRGERRTAQQQIYISLAGPVAGFLLAAATLIFAKGIGGVVEPHWYYNIVPGWEIHTGPRITPQLRAVLSQLLYINIFWGVVNLLPVFPLDGGQIAMQLFLLRDSYGGMVRCLQLSIVVAIAVVVFAIGVMREGGWYPAMLFGSLAVSNYINYMQIHGQGRF